MSIHKFTHKEFNEKLGLESKVIDYDEDKDFIYIITEGVERELA